MEKFAPWTGLRFWNLLLVVVVLFAQTACIDLGGDDEEDDEPTSSTPTARVSPATGSTLKSTSSLIITFSKSMNRNSIVVSGSAATSFTKSWSTTTYANDTLTITAPWDDGDERTVAVNGADTSGTAITELTATYHVLGDNAVYVSPNGSNSNSGAHDAPKATLAAAQTLATSLALDEVRAAVGTYTVTTFYATKTIKGGYDEDDWSLARTLTDGATVINSTATDTGSLGAPNYTVGIATSGTVDGFTINAPAAGDYTAAVYIDGVANATLSNSFAHGGAGAQVSTGVHVGEVFGGITLSANTIDAGTGALIQHGLYVGATTGADLIDSCTITANGGSGRTEAIALYAKETNRFTLSSSTLTGGDATLSAGFYQDGTGLVGYRGLIDDNIIHGGTGDTSYGVRLDADILAGTTTITGNTIYGGSGGAQTQGLYITAADENRPYIISGNKIHGGDATATATALAHDIAQAEIHNNSIFGGNAPATRGISILQSATTYYPFIRNNTINGGNAVNTSSAIYSAGSGDNIENNILFNSSGTERFALDFWTATGDITHNGFKNTTVLLHTRWDCSNSCVDYNTLNDVQTVLSSSGPDYLDSTDAINLTDDSDPDDEWSSTDYSLAISSDTDIKTGGLDGDNEGWSFTDDFTGTTRTGASGIGWSLGAFEL